MINTLKKVTPSAVKIFIITLFISQQIFAQDIVLRDTTISTEVTYLSHGIIAAGPDLTISGSGVVTLRARNRISFLSGVHILGGGQLYALTGIVAGIQTDKEVALPTEFVVYPNYPNPFNPSTQIRYVLPITGQVKADIYTVFGEKVKTLFTGVQQGGAHSLTWDGTNQSGQKMSSGMYYLRIEAGTYRSVLKMTLLK